MALVFVEKGYNDFTKSYDLDLLATNNNMLKFIKRNTRTRCEICSELTIKTPERYQCRRSSVFVVNLEHTESLSQVKNLEAEASLKRFHKKKKQFMVEMIYTGNLHNLPYEC